MTSDAFAEPWAQVQQWLDLGTAATWARRDDRVPAHNGAAWHIDLQDGELPFQSVRLWLPANFPARTCELYVDPRHFLRVPHVEADGHLCLGLSPLPEDYEDPIGAVTRAFATLQQQLLVPARDPTWADRQFHDERSSYWAQMCMRRRTLTGQRPLPMRTLVDVGALDGWTDGTLAAYVPQGASHRRYTLQIAVPTGTDPNQVAARHGWAGGMMVRGNALFVRLPSELLWIPATWPQTFSELESLIARATGNDVSLSQWLAGIGWNDDPQPRPKKRKKRPRGRKAPSAPPSGQRPLLVTLAHESTLFGYQLFAPVVQGLREAHIEPLRVIRNDPDWALARDQELPTLHARRAKRVLVLGCGSLGSPLITALARAGVGHLDLVDPEVMDTENTARHELGIDENAQPKALALARRLRKQIPGIEVRGFQDRVETWCPKHCRPGDYDLVIECTAESSVRTFLAHMRERLFGACPIIHAWVEPLCSAGHVVLTQPDMPWPPEDPADSHVNASDLSVHDTRIHLPACAGGFHPYGAADIALVAAFTAERVIGVLDDSQQASTVWSWIRASAFFDQLTVPVTPRPVVPLSRFASDSAAITRELASVLAGP